MLTHSNGQLWRLFVTELWMAMNTMGSLWSELMRKCSKLARIRHWPEELDLKKIHEAWMKLLQGILVLGTQSWRYIMPANPQSESQQFDSENCPEEKALSDVLAAVKLIAVTFKEPLQASGVNLLNWSTRWKGKCSRIHLTYLSIKIEKYQKEGKSSYWSQCQ